MQPRHLQALPEADVGAEQDKATGVAVRLRVSVLLWSSVFLCPTNRRGGPMPSCLCYRIFLFSPVFGMMARQLLENLTQKYSSSHGKMHCILIVRFCRRFPCRVGVIMPKRSRGRAAFQTAVSSSHLPRPASTVTLQPSLTRVQRLRASPRGKARNPKLRHNHGDPKTTQEPDAQTSLRLRAMAGATPTPTQTGHVSTRTKQFPSTLVPVAVLLAVAVAALSLLPSVAQAVWELPHLFLLGLVISYAVFAQKNAEAGDGTRAWNSRYHPDDPLVVVADHAVSDGEDGASERPLSLPVRRLKTAAQESETGDASYDGIGEETDSSASTAGSWAGARGAPSPPSVLDAVKARKLNAAATPSTMSKDFPGYDSLVPCDQSFNDDDGEVTDWDEDADESDDMTVSSERSFRGNFIACGNHGNDGNDGDGDDKSVDEELLELAVKAGPEGEYEVDRKADEFIAKFREQIRLQRFEPAMT